MDKIILLGYMGSGKSTTAKLLAEKIGFAYLDLDTVIENDANLSVAQIFSEKGEIAFRRQEHLLLQKLMESTQNFVLSLGGGTPCYAGNDSLLHGKGILSVYLKGSIGTLYSRLAPDKKGRPLLAAVPDEELSEFIAKHLFERSFFYNKADAVVTIDGKSPDEIVGQIEQLLA